jgi:hypothetical protein
MITMKKILLLLAFASSLLYGQDVTKVGTTAAKFLSIPIGPRATALGGAFVSIADDPTAMYWNAAGIAKLTQNELVLDHTSWFVDIGLNYGGIVLPMGTFGTMGVNVTSINYGDMDVTTEDNPEGTGETFNASSYAFGVSYARSLTEWFAIGTNVKYVTEKIWHESAHGVAVDVGTIFTTPFRGIRLGASISNFGSKLQLSGEDLLIQKRIADQYGTNPATNAYLATDEFDMPLALHIGISNEVIQNENQQLTVAIDAVHPNDNSESINVGAEYLLFNKVIALRGGYRSLFLQDSAERYTLGGGVNQQFENMRIKFDYSYQAYERFSGVHKFSLGLIF